MAPTTLTRPTLILMGTCKHSHRLCNSFKASSIVHIVQNIFKGYESALEAVMVLLEAVRMFLKSVRANLKAIRVLVESGLVLV